MSEQIEAAAKVAGLEIENITRGEFAFVKGAPHTPEGFLSGKPILLGRLKRDGKTDFYAISFREKEHEDVAVIRNLEGHEVAEFHASIFVPRRPHGAVVRAGSVSGFGCTVYWGHVDHAHYLSILCPGGGANIYWYD